MKTIKTILVVAALAIAGAGCKGKGDKKDDPQAKGTDDGSAKGTDKGSGDAPAKKDDNSGLAGDGKAVETAAAGGKASAVLDAVKTEQAEQAALTAAKPALTTNAIKLMGGQDIVDGGDLKLQVNANGDESEIRKTTAQVLEKVIALINGAVKFPKDIPVVMDTCGEPNAFYSSQDQAIKFCDEWAPFSQQAFARYKTDQDEILRMTMNTVIETFIHELGHCLIDQWKLPATGREEDAADQLAAFVLIDEAEDTSQIIMDAAEFWLILAVTRGEAGRNNFADEHSLDQVRFYNFACMVYGSKPDKYVSLVEDYDLPLKRAWRCADEYKGMRQAWGGLLEKILIQG